LLVVSQGGSLNTNNSVSSNDANSSPQEKIINIETSTSQDQNMEFHSDQDTCARENTDHDSKLSWSSELSFVKDNSSSGKPSLIKSFSSLSVARSISDTAESLLSFPVLDTIISELLSVPPHKKKIQDLKTQMKTWRMILN
jgi:hypothetical protein